MRFKEITIDSEIVLDSVNTIVRKSDSTSLVISENSAAAVVAIGFKGATGAFVPYNNGTLTTDAVADHGVGAILMIKVTGISSASVTVGWTE